MLSALSPQHLTSLILHSLQEGKPFLSQVAQSRLLTLVGQDNVRHTHTHTHTTPRTHTPHTQPRYIHNPHTLTPAPQSLDGVRDTLRLLPLSNRSVAYVVMTMMQAIERHSGTR